MTHYRDWQLFDELPPGWKFDNTCGSPLCGYSFANDGRSVLRGGKRALVRIPAQKQLFDAVVALSKMETSTMRMDENQNLPQVVDVHQVMDAHYVRTVNDLARQKFKQKLLNDILVDLTICEIEGWCKLEYIKELKNLIDSLGRKICTINEASQKTNAPDA